LWQELSLIAIKDKNYYLSGGKMVVSARVVTYKVVSARVVT